MKQHRIPIIVGTTSLSLSMFFFLSFVGDLGIAQITPPSDLMSETEIRRAVAEGERNLTEADKRLKEIGLKNEAMLAAWKTADELFNKKNRTKTEEAKLQQARKVLKPFLEAQDPKSYLGDDRERIKKDIALIDSIAQDTHRMQRSLMALPPPVRKKESSKGFTLQEMVQESRIQVTESKVKGLEALKKLDDIELEYERKEIGAYIADKFAQFMNSNSICKAKNHCNSRSTEDPVDPAILYQEIFPEVQPLLQRKGDRETYDKVHDRRKGLRSDIPAGGSQ